MGIRGKGEGKSLSIILEKRMIDKKIYLLLLGKKVIDKFLSLMIGGAVLKKINTEMKDTSI